MTITNRLNEFTVEGYEGYFLRTIKTGNWARFVHYIPNENGIGAQRKGFAGSVSMGNYGSEGIPSCSNNAYTQQVEALIRRYVQNHPEYQKSAA